MRAHIGVLTWNRLALTRLCLESLLTKTPEGYGLTVVDNGSQDGTQAYLRELASAHPFMRVHLLRRNMGVAVASNLAWADAASADCFVKLDNDVEILDGHWLQRLTCLLETYPHVGMAAYRLCDWHQLTRDTLPLTDGGYAEITTVCGGACTAIGREAHEKIGFWNEGYGRYGHEDQDYSWRITKAGYALAALDATDMVAHRGYAPGQVDESLEAAKQQSNGALLSGDAAYHLYTFLFDEGLLPLKMPRKYVPRLEGEVWTFAFNPAFRPLQRLLNELVKTVPVDAKGRLTTVDLRAWRKAQGGTYG
ncbi:MAG: glycosyltransferase [Desulfovibrio sp.]|nr:glycosyltransferase [Desulfovibrio sp.]